MSKLKFEPNAIKALKIIQNTNDCLYLTGKAGAGKSTLINYFREKTKKKITLLGTTGVSAINVGGQTIHKFFGFIPNKKGSRMKGDAIGIAKETDVFIIDEAPMMRADLFDKMDRLMKRLMNNNEFMGGKQFIFVGDLYQLPPIPEREYFDAAKTKRNPAYDFYKEHYRGLFFFNAQEFIQEKFHVVELQKVYRQDDPTLVRMLNRVRIGEKSPDITSFFNGRLTKKENFHPKSIYIATTKRIVNKKNEEELAKIKGKSFFSASFVEGDFPEEIYPTDTRIDVKEGARIMFVVNHKEGLYVNGTLGTITTIYTNPRGFMNKCDVELDNGEIIPVIRKTWTNSPGDDPLGEPIIDGTFSQMPFKLAFAITIHKVQGKTFDHIVIDFGRKVFAAGQAYVALSRATSYEGIQLVRKMNLSDIIVDEDVINYMN